MAKKSQIDKFREKARELEADEEERKFNKSLERVAKHHKIAPSEDGAPAPKPSKEGR